MGRGTKLRGEKMTKRDELIAFFSEALAYISVCPHEEIEEIYSNLQEFFFPHFENLSEEEFPVKKLATLLRDRLREEEKCPNS
jgi:hypothetical protein